MLFPVSIEIFNLLNQSPSYKITKQLLNLSLVCILGYFVVVMGNVLIVFRNLQNGCEAGSFLLCFSRI